MDKAVVDEMKLSAQLYLEKATSEVIKLSDGFYKGAQDDTWSQFSSFIEGLQFLFHLYEAEKTLTAQSGYSSLPLSTEPIFRSLQEQTVQLEEAASSQDYVLLADLLKYEFAPLYEQLGEAIVENEGMQQ